MQEVTYYLNGERNYMNMRGDTGPLVYPAGFVYVFSLLYYGTDNGQNIPVAQCVFIGLYILTLIVILRIYARGKCVPLWSLGLLLVSKRIHSIFILRMFNDCIAVLCSYIALLLFLNDKVYWCLLVSLCDHCMDEILTLCAYSGISGPWFIRLQVCSNTICTSALLFMHSYATCSYSLYQDEYPAAGSGAAAGVPVIPGVGTDIPMSEYLCSGAADTGISLPSHLPQGVPLAILRAGESVHVQVDSQLEIPT